MNLFGIKLGKGTKKEERSVGIIDGAIQFGTTSTFTTNRAMNLSAVYMAVNQISDSIAQMPFEVYAVDKDGYRTKNMDHPAYSVLNESPNATMTRFTFIKSLIVSCLLRGNGFAYIRRDFAGNVIGLEFIPSELVTILEQSDGSVKYSVTGIKSAIEAVNMIHIPNITYDQRGIYGISTLKHAFQSMGLMADAEAHAANFFRGGANTSGILTMEGNPSSQQKNDVRKTWREQLDSNLGGQSNGIVVLSSGQKFQPISVNPVEAQLLETRKFSIEEVARWFCISPIKLGDLSHSSYASVEAANIDFLTTTLAPWLAKIELEFQRKVFKPSERKSTVCRFDSSVLLRTNKSEMATYYSQMLNLGAMTTNEIRRQIDMPKIEGGDNALVQVNLQKLSDVGKAQESNVLHD